MLSTQAFTLAFTLHFTTFKHSHSRIQTCENIWKLYRNALTEVNSRVNFSLKATESVLALLAQAVNDSSRKLKRLVVAFCAPMEKCSTPHKSQWTRPNNWRQWTQRENLFLSFKTVKKGFQFSLLQFFELAELFTCFQFHYQNSKFTHMPRRFIQAQENCYLQPFHENSFPAWVVTYRIESEFFVELASKISLS